ncbi:phosphate transport system regulatory protein PhoU [Roseburia sp. AM51-8]|uniref:phosphate signaling complex protein PhoU n=1 Tax=unclassified Roseburia TaxID=2637578 RepID=UPI000E483848|nr:MULTISPECIES: phosphate signaling complex protein PhoU [unclassified Roseburia]MDY3873295.1 phosphate signaling complex protein PhoU [Roseburia lenta]RHO33170.1 phosphate transport system regulatory protein PhoU [Roseburia sp. AM16-25]RHQ01304.1 phosphate transport system regulatory protein PhoU [Roseburia sp. AM51-8]
MRNRFDRQLEELHVELIEMGSMCEDVIRKTSKLLQSGDAKVAKEIRKEDSNIDEQERLVESLCLKLLLQQQPVAKDLRKVSAALKMITDMERIGDQASDIAEIIETTDFSVPTNDVKLAKMAETTIAMVTESIDAYVKQDLELVREVIARDDEVDDLFLEVRQEIADDMVEAGDPMSSLDLLMIAKYFERIGDHATNIAEWVEFSITGTHKDADIL